MIIIPLRQVKMVEERLPMPGPPVSTIICTGDSGSVKRLVSSSKDSDMPCRCGRTAGSKALLSCNSRGLICAGDLHSVNSFAPGLSLLV